jgi:hypothetical protein
MIVGTGAASLLAGSLGGAVGVGVAYPFDTLKTKSQVYGQLRREAEKSRKRERRRTRREEEQRRGGGATTTAMIDDGVGAANEKAKASVPFFVATPEGHSGGRVMERSTTMTMTTTTIAMEQRGTIDDYDDDDDDDELDDYDDEIGASGRRASAAESDENLLSLIGVILENEGISGFFGGVKAMMIGQALIKSVAFSANELALGALMNDASSSSSSLVAGSAGLVDDGSGGGAVVATSFVTLMLAAGFAGFVTSFLVAPVGEFFFFLSLSIYLSSSFVSACPASHPFTADITMIASRNHRMFKIK